jgi:hypothetical protein
MVSGNSCRRMYTLHRQTIQNRFPAARDEIVAAVATDDRHFRDNLLGEVD